MKKHKTLEINDKKININKLMILIMIIGILIRAIYIIYTPVTERQHDVYSIENEGHLGYIYRIYETGKLPETNNIQFYHPPLFHYLGAGWLRVNSLFNISEEKAIEGLQIITAICSSLILLVVYKINKEIKIKDIYKVLIMGMMAFHPTFIILAGSINNDILMILLTFVIILYLIKWHKESSIKNTIVLALVTGLAVMTKVSAAIMAVPILYTFFDRYLREFKENKKILNWKFILKMILFGVISLPIGLWHPIRNLILFNQPLGGVLIPAQIYNVSNYSITSRFFSVSFTELIKEIYVVIPGDHNIFSYIVKSSIFGEWTYENIDILATLLKCVNLVLIIISVALSIMCMVKNNKKQENKYIIDLLAIIWIINLVSYYGFNLQYPYACTMDFRYLVPTIFTGVTLICIALDKFIKNDIIKEIIGCLIMVFCILSIAMFLLIR